MLIWVVDGKPTVWVQAWGGTDPIPGVDDGGMKPKKTTPGRFIIQSRGPHSTHKWPYSLIPWGTRLQVERRGRDHEGVVMYEAGMIHPRWRPVSSVIPHLTTAQLKKDYDDLYGKTGMYDDDRDGIPDRWVFNDFGPWAVRYYEDTNHDGRLDGKEALSGEMIHTTPEDEAENAKGVRVSLGSSHGCIHVSPRGRDKMLAAGAFTKGTPLLIHTYEERLPAGWRP